MYVMAQRSERVEGDGEVQGKVRERCSLGEGRGVKRCGREGVRLQICDVGCDIVCGRKRVCVENRMCVCVCVCVMRMVGSVG